MTRSTGRIAPEKLASMIGEFLTDLRRGLSSTPVIVLADSDLLADVGTDSLEMAELLFWLEDLTGAKLDFTRIELKHFRCVRELANLINGSIA